MRNITNVDWIILDVRLVGPLIDDLAGNIMWTGETEEAGRRVIAGFRQSGEYLRSKCEGPWRDEFALTIRKGDPRTDDQRTVCDVWIHRGGRHVGIKLVEIKPRGEDPTKNGI